MENAIIRFFTIYLVGIAGIWKAIPVGMALKSDPFETAIFTALGSITTVILMYYFGETVKIWAQKKWDKNTLKRKKGKLSTIMNNYGVAGLGLICPGLFGPITTIIVGLLLVKKTSILMPYLITGIIVWSFY